MNKKWIKSKKYNLNYEWIKKFRRDRKNYEENLSEYKTKYNNNIINLFNEKE